MRAAIFLRHCLDWLIGPSIDSLVRQARADCEARAFTGPDGELCVTFDPEASREMIHRKPRQHWG